MTVQETNHGGKESVTKHEPSKQLRMLRAQTLRYNVAQMVMNLVLIVYVIASLAFLGVGSGLYGLGLPTALTNNEEAKHATIAFLVCCASMHVLYVITAIIGLAKFLINLRSSRFEVQLDIAWLAFLVVAHSVVWCFFACWNLLSMYIDTTKPDQLQSLVTLKAVVGMSGVLQMLVFYPALIVGTLKLRSVWRLRELVRFRYCGSVDPKTEASMPSSTLEDAIRRVKTIKDETELAQIEKELESHTSPCDDFKAKIPPHTFRALAQAPGLPTVKWYTIGVVLGIFGNFLFAASCILISIASIFFAIQTISPTFVVTRTVSSAVYCAGMSALFGTGLVGFCGDMMRIHLSPHRLNRDPMFAIPPISRVLMVIGAFLLMVHSIVLQWLTDKNMRQAQSFIATCGSPLLMVSGVFRLVTTYDSLRLVKDIPNEYVATPARRKAKLNAFLNFSSSLLFTMGSFVLNIRSPWSSPQKEISIAGYVLLAVVFLIYLASALLLIGQLAFNSIPQFFQIVERERQKRINNEEPIDDTPMGPAEDVAPEELGRSSNSSIEATTESNPDVELGDVQIEQAQA